MISIQETDLMLLLVNRGFTKTAADNLITAIKRSVDSKVTNEKSSIEKRYGISADTKLIGKLWERYCIYINIKPTSKLKGVSLILVRDACICLQYICIELGMDLDLQTIDRFLKYSHYVSEKSGYTRLSLRALSYNTDKVLELFNKANIVKESGDFPLIRRMQRKYAASLKINIVPELDNVENIYYFYMALQNIKRHNSYNEKSSEKIVDIFMHNNMCYWKDKGIIPSPKNLADIKALSSLSKLK